MAETIWTSHNVEAKIIEILDNVHNVNEYHHFGRPYVSAYQLAIAVDERYPEIAQALDATVGGAGTGKQDSLSQYLARELSRRIKADPAYPVQGAFLSNQAEYKLSYVTADGQPVTSSLTGSNFYLSLYRLRPVS